MTVRVARGLIAPVLGLALAAGLLAACSTGTADQPSTTSAAVTPSETSPAPATSGPAGTPTGGATTAGAPTGTATSAGPTASVAPTSSPKPSLAAATVTVTNSGWDAAADRLWVSGFVPDPENGGTCTLTATKGAATVTVTQGAQADATTTTCVSVTIAHARLSSGTWSAVLAYHSATRAGQAAPVTIEVP
jgi:hypothetical protein